MSVISWIYNDYFMSVFGPSLNIPEVLITSSLPLKTIKFPFSLSLHSKQYINLFTQDDNFPLVERLVSMGRLLSGSHSACDNHPSDLHPATPHCGTVHCTTRGFIPRWEGGMNLDKVCLDLISIGLQGTVLIAVCHLVRQKSFPLGVPL